MPKSQKDKITHKGITMKTKLLLPLLSLTLGALPLLAELKYFPKDKEQLISLIADENIKLDEIDTSKITDMSYLFCATTNDTNDVYLQECKLAIRKEYQGIEKWDTQSSIKISTSNAKIQKEDEEVVITSLESNIASFIKQGE